jgi:hypothetical protein
MLKFNEKKDLATIKICMKEGSYVKINGINLDGHYERRKSDGNIETSWVGDQMWVSEKISQDLLNRKLAEIIGTRTEENAKLAVKEE